MTVFCQDSKSKLASLKIMIAEKRISVFWKGLLIDLFNHYTVLIPCLPIPFSVTPLLLSTAMGFIAQR